MRLSLLTCFFLLLAIFPSVVTGQASELSQIEQIDQPVSPTLDQNNDSQLTNMEQEYFHLLEQYRQQEQAYFLAKNQFLQINTLAAQEIAIKETKAALIIRANVLIQYLDILKLLLEQTNGIPLEEKNPQLVELDLLREDLLLHKNSVEAATDRLSVDAAADFFVPTFSKLNKSVYYTLSLIKIGRVQTAIDKLSVVRGAVGQELDLRSMSVSQQAEKQRGLAEIDRTQQSIEQQFAPIAQMTYARKTESSLQTLTNLSTSLTKSFTLIYQNVSFLEEIRQ